MIDLQKLIRSERGGILMSILLGFGIATLFRPICKGKSCITFTAPPKDFLNNGIFKFNDKCYKNHPERISCQSQMKKVKLDEINTIKIWNGLF